jgi:hypothetical protein
MVSRRVHPVWHSFERTTVVKKLFAGFVVCGLGLVVGCQGSSTSSGRGTTKTSTATTVDKKDGTVEKKTEEKTIEKKDEPKKDEPKKDEK